MKKKLYDSSQAAEFYLNHYIHAQKSGGYLPYFEGVVHHQVGSGIWGNILKSAVPFIKKGAKALLPHALDLGKNVITDVLENKQNIKKSLKKRGIQSLKESGKTLAKRAKKDIFS